MSKKNDENKDGRVILFSTRFIEKEDALFSEDNIDSSSYCCCPEFLKFFLSANLPPEIVQYFNRLYYKDFFSQYKDEKGTPLINTEDNSKEIRDKLWRKIPEVTFTKPLWISFFSDLDRKERLFDITVNREKCKFEFTDKDVDAKSLLKIIQDNEGSVYNQEAVLNTDFGGASDKQTIDRRFKIYRLKDCNVGNVLAVYGVWCLKEKTEEEKWYEVLYKELKTQMKDEFKSVKEILYFLHDGDIGERKPFDVKHYQEDKKSFGFLDDNKTLSVAIFQHSLSDIATVLSNSDKESAIKKALEEMEMGGKLAFLNDLSDYVAYWQDGGKDKYIENVENGQNKYGINSLIPKEDIENNSKSVKDVLCEVKRLIDELSNS